MFFKKLVLGLALLFCAVMFIAGTTNYDALGLDSFLTVGTYASVATELRVTDVQLGLGVTSLDSLGRVKVAIRNKMGAALTAGRVVELDTLYVTFNTHKVLPDIVYSDTGGVFDSEGGPGTFRFTLAGTPTTDSLTLYGMAITGPTTIESVTELIELGTTINDVRFSNYLWASFDSLVVDTTGGTGIDSLQIAYLSAGGVVEAAAPNGLAYAVTLTATVADNAIGEACTFGAVKVKCKAATGKWVLGGFALRAAANGSVLPLAAGSGALGDTTIAGIAIGTKDDVSDTASIWMHFDPR